MMIETPAVTEVCRLNQLTFEAEDNPSRAREILEPILSGKFYIVRAKGVVQDKEPMIAQAQGDKTGRRRDLKSVDVRLFGNAAVVRTLLTLLEQTGEKVGDYVNTKVFVLQEGGWQCVAWQVTEVKPQ